MGNFAHISVTGLEDEIVEERARNHGIGINRGKNRGIYFGQNKK